VSIFLGRREGIENDGRPAPGALERLARQEEGLPLLEQRIGDRDFLSGGFGNTAPDPEQHDRVRIVEDQQDRMAKWGREKPFPIEVRGLGFEAELAGDIDQPADEHALAIDQVAPPHRADLGVDAVLHAHPEQAREAGLRGNRQSRYSISPVAIDDFDLAPLPGFRLRPVRCSFFGLHVLLQPGQAQPPPPDALGLILI